MSARALGSVTGLALMAAVCVVPLAGCSSHPVQASSSASSPAGHARYVTPERRNLTSVVVASGSVVASPRFVLPASRSGAVHLAVKPGQSLTAGQRVGTVAGKPVVAAHGGRVVTVTRSATVVRNMPLVVIEYDGFGVSVDVSPTDMYRIYGKPVSAHASLTGGASGVACAVVPAATSAGSPPAGAGPSDGSPPGAGSTTSSGQSALCLLKHQTVAFAGAPAKVGLTTTSVKNALTLPLTAVAGSRQTGQVTVIGPHGHRSKRQVSLGITDGTYVQITGGLKPGEHVAAQAPAFP